MGVIEERAAARHAAIQAELRAKYPGLFPKPPAPPVDRTAIALGRDPRGAAVLLPERPRKEHMHVIGTTGGGKSKFLEHGMRQDIAQERGVLLIDPHGGHRDSVFRSKLAWLDKSGYLAKRTVHIIDANATSHAIGFNPLARPDADTDLSVVAGVTLEAFSRAWGGEDTSQKPTIERVLMACFIVLAELGLTLVELPLLLDRDDRHGLRAYALERVTDRYAHDELQRLHELSLDRRRNADYDREVIGPFNRIGRFLRTPAIRAMLGQTERLLDIRQALDEGHIILCNLSGGSQVYERDADMLGRLLVRSLFFHAKRRAHPERPFMVYLDECHRYLSGDLESMLAESRKYGVAAVLAHQWLEQLATESDNMLAAVRNATNVKVVFRLKDAKEAEDLAHMVVPLDLEIPVQTLTRPTVVGHRRAWLASESTGKSSSRITSRGVSAGETEAFGETIATSFGHSSSEGVSSGHTVGENASEGVTSGASFGESAGQGSSTMAATSSGASMSMGVVTTPTEDTFFLPPQEPTILSENYGLGFSTSESLGIGSSAMRGQSSAVSEAKSRMSGRSAATSSAHSRSIGHSSSVSHAESVARARSLAHSMNEGESRGESETRGASEGLEPILEDRPSSVHGKDNVLYMAAQTLRSLPTGHAFLNYVGARGMVATLLVVPPIKEFTMTNEAFVSLRTRLLSQSAAATPAVLARALIDERERAFRSFTRPKPDASPEPASFRIATRADAPRRGSAGPVAARRALSGQAMLEALLIDATPLTDGGHEQAEPARSQGSRSPEATARSAAIDGARVRPKKARHAVNDAPRAPSKV